MRKNETRNTLCASALIAAGALIVVGHAMSVDMGDSGARYVHELVADRPLHVAGGLVTAVAALLLSVGLIATPKLFDAGRGRIARVAASCASVGAAGMAMGLAMVVMVMGTLAGKDTSLAVRAYEVLNHGTLSSLPFLVAYLFTLGTLALAVLLISAGARLRLIGVLVLVGTVADFGSPSGGVVTAAVHVPQAIGFALLGVELLRPGALGTPATSPYEVRDRTAVAS
jgi:hypothetical protein